MVVVLNQSADGSSENLQHGPPLRFREIQAKLDKGKTYEVVVDVVVLNKKKFVSKCLFS